MNMLLKIMELLRDRYALRRKVRNLENELAKTIQYNLELHTLIQHGSYPKEKQLRAVIESYKKRDMKKYEKNRNTIKG